MMFTQDRVSILITIYNGAKTLDRCFQSLQNQTYPHMRIVCVDDASTDNTHEKLLHWQEIFGTDKLFILSNKYNLGVTKSSNRGLQSITTPYTARIDVDDWWEPTKLEKQIGFLEKNPEYGIIGCNYENINKKIRKSIVTPESDTIIKKNIIRKNPFAHSCVVYKTDLARMIGGYDESIRYGGDYELYLRFFPKTKFHNIQEFLCFRSIESDGISITKQREQMLQGVRTKIKYIQMYGLSKLNYLSLAELLLVACTPRIIRDFKRTLFG